MEDQNPDHVAIQIAAKLVNAEPVFTTECCIYRVPHEIRQLNQDAYTPKVVSIGPFHHDKPRLRNMESHKRIYCQKFIERTQTSLDKLVSRVLELEPRVRHCYSDKIKLRKEDLIEVILVDCGFIFEYFMRCFLDERKHDDVILTERWLTSNITMDLLLLENQLPLFVLKKLYKLACASDPNGNHPPFMKLTFHYFSHFNSQKLTSCTSIKHFTDLLRTFYLQPSESDRRPSRGAEQMSHLNSATELNEAGVKFKVINKKNQCLLELQLSRGRYLEIPKLPVDDDTEILFRNMLALEQCSYPDESYITDYVAVLDNLINTGKDVDVLVQNGIILNCLGDSNAVAKLFNGLLKNIVHEGFNSDYLRICKELSAYYNHPNWHSRIAALKRDYCKTTWQAFASSAAIVLLILTLIQTVCSILQVV